MDDGNESVKVQRTPGVSCWALPWVTAHGATVTRLVQGRRARQWEMARGPGGQEGWEEGCAGVQAGLVTQFDLG